MRRLSIPALIGCLVAVLAPMLLVGQTSTGAQPELARPPFAAIQSTLSQAADSALESSARPASMPDEAEPSALQKTSVQAQQKSPAGDRKSGALDGLSPLIQPILVREGVPAEIAAVVQVESAGNPLALSPKGARGLWQLMPDTARRYGLVVNGERDERTNVEQSTTGAARYLHDLYAQFGSWPLALAAYNTGERNLQRAIDRAHSRDFATLSFLGYLPAETRNYVPAVLSRMSESSPAAPINSRESSAANLVYAVATE